MTYVCGKIPCGAHSGGCVDPHCPINSGPTYPRASIGPPYVPIGCICPPTAEQTCQSATCPRKLPKM
jgi:hypothetical protein